MAHALPPLPYPYGALEPTIDELTMRLHHDNYHGGYVAALNAALEGTAWALGETIETTFGSVRELERRVSAAGAGRVGSGWAWLVHDGAGLAVRSTANQDSPLMGGEVPLLGVDVWEHAYYLRYQHRRADYLEAWWNVVDWQRVGARYAAATSDSAGGGRSRGNGGDRA
jgi:Fe-Mn family superoxide dismutase